MAVGAPVIIIGAVAVITAVMWPIILHDIFIVGMGIGRKLQPISDFPYQCRRIAGPGLQACEDMWLSESTRQLFMACSSSLGRKEWMPNIGRLNVSGASQEDKLIAMSIDKPIGVGFEYRVLETPGQGNLHLVGFTGVDKSDHVELYLVNNRPSFNITTGTLADQTEVGANSTIELFKVYPEAEEVEFVKTYAHEQIATPNNIAPLGDGSFYFTNDHGQNKVGFRHQISQIIGDGTVSYCNKDSKCKRVDIGIRFPNGLALGKDRLLYVPSTFSGNLRVYELQKNNEIKQIDTVEIPYPLDNVTPDANGDLWIATLPDLGRSLPAFDDPMNAKAPAGVMRVHKRGHGEYEVEKMLEDDTGDVLPMTTTVVHDANTGRLFLSSVISPFITVCEPKGIADQTEREETGRSPPDEL